MSFPILAIDQILTTVVGSPAEEDLQAYVLSMVFANAAARTARNQANDGADKASIFNSQWNSQLGNLGWVVTAAGTSSMQSFSSGQTTTVDHELRTQLASSGVNTTLDALATLATDNSPSAQALTQMFWESGSADIPFVAALGQFLSTSDGPTFELATFTLLLDSLMIEKRGSIFGQATKLNPDSVVGLFESVLASSVELSVTHITARLQPDIFAAKRADLVQKLQGRAASHFCSVPAGLAKGVE